MGMGCGMSIIKYILFIFNLLCALCGLALLILGIVFLVHIQDMEKLAENSNVTTVPILLIVLGSIIFIIAFFGCCGAIRESHCMTLTYSCFLMLLIIAQVILGALVLTKNDEISKHMQKEFEDKIWKDRYETGNKEFIDVVQENLKCCGLTGPSAWVTGAITNVFTGSSDVAFPKSCCAKQFLDTCTPLNAYSTGCREAVYQAFGDGGKVIGFVVIGISAIELVGFIFACCLANSIRNQERRYA